MRARLMSGDMLGFTSRVAERRTMQIPSACFMIRGGRRPATRAWRNGIRSGLNIP